MDERVVIIGVIVFIVAFLMILINPFYIVPTGSQAVVFRFGKVHAVVGEGFHGKIPIVDKIYVVSVQNIRREEFGYRTVDPGPPAKYKDVPAETKMLTSDNKIVHVYWAMQYRVSNPANYIINLPLSNKDRIKLIRDVAESVFRQIVAEHTFDDILTTEKELIQTEAKANIQKIMNKLGYGIDITAVQIQDVLPPNEVQNAFNDVISARAEKEKAVLEAQSYANKILAEVQGTASKVINEAEAYKYQRIKQAEGQASRISMLLEKYKLSPTTVKTELLFEALKKMMENGVKFVVVEGGVKVFDINKLLEQMGNSISSQGR